MKLVIEAMVKKETMFYYAVWMGYVTIRCLFPNCNKKATKSLPEITFKFLYSTVPKFPADRDLALENFSKCPFT